MNTFSTFYPNSTCSAIIKSGREKGQKCQNECIENHEACQFHIDRPTRQELINRGILSTCRGITYRNVQCSRLATDDQYCSYHDPSILRTPTKKQLLQNLTQKGYTGLSKLTKKQLEEFNPEDHPIKHTKGELYQELKRKGYRGLSKLNKSQLENLINKSEIF